MAESAAGEIAKPENVSSMELHDIGPGVVGIGWPI